MSAVDDTLLAFEPAPGGVGTVITSRAVSSKPNGKAGIMVSKETSERVQLCQRYFDDMLARAHSANDDLQEASRKLTDALKAWEREFFSCDEPKTNRTKSQPAVTFWCPVCKQTSVADQNDDGTYTCPHCGQ